MPVPLPAAAKRLPPDQWIVEPGGPDSIAVAMHEHGGALWWTWFTLPPDQIVARTPEPTHATLP